VVSLVAWRCCARKVGELRIQVIVGAHGEKVNK